VARTARRNNLAGWTLLASVLPGPPLVILPPSLSTLQQINAAERKEGSAVGNHTTTQLIEATSEAAQMVV
jgi:hypothetical protein